VLRVEYALSETAQVKPTMSVNDLLQLLHHHWPLCTDYYPIEWQRVQHALLILLMAYTSARPGVLVEY
jgi:hypothetical protein